MALRRVFVSIQNTELQLVLTERSTVLLEPANLEFETIEDAVEHIVVHPEVFSSEVYEALLEALNARGGGAL